MNFIHEDLGERFKDFTLKNLMHKYSLANLQIGKTVNTLLKLIYLYCKVLNY